MTFKPERKNSSDLMGKTTTTSLSKWEYQSRWNDITQERLFGRATSSENKENEFSFFGIRQSQSRCLLTKQIRNFQWNSSSLHTTNLTPDKNLNRSNDYLSEFSMRARDSFASLHSAVDFLFRDSITSKKLQNSKSNLKSPLQKSSEKLPVMELRSFPEDEEEDQNSDSEQVEHLQQIIEIDDSEKFSIFLPTYQQIGQKRSFPFDDSVDQKKQNETLKRSQHVQCCNNCKTRIELYERAVTLQCGHRVHLKCNGITQQRNTKGPTDCEACQLQNQSLKQSNFI